MSMSAYFWYLLHPAVTWLSLVTHKGPGLGHWGRGFWGSRY
jgi:hypothetical protein